MSENKKNMGKKKKKKKKKKIPIDDGFEPTQ